MRDDSYKDYLNTINFMLLGNFDIPETHTRKFSYFKISTELVQDKEFWTKMYNNIDKEENIYALYLMLMNRDISDFVKHSQQRYEELRMPCKLALIKDKISNVQKYIKHVCLQGEGFYGMRKDKHVDCNEYLLKSGKDSSEFTYI